MRKSLRALAALLLAVVAVVALRSGADRSDATQALRPSGTPAPPVPRAHYMSPRGQDAASFVLAGNSRGDALLAWNESAAFGHSRLWVRGKHRGASFGRARALTGAHVSAVSASAAVGDDGTAMVVWVELGRGSARVMAAMRPPGGSFGNPKRLSSAFPDAEVDLAVARDGTAAVVWDGDVAGAQQVVARLRRPTGSWGGPQVLTSGTRGVRFPRVAFDGAGDATVVWERGPREYPDSAAPPVKQRILATVRPHGGSFGAHSLVSDPARDGRDAALAVNERGDAAVAWNSTHGRNLPGSRIGLALRHAGGAFGPPRLLTPPGEAELPELRVGSAGSVVGVWTVDSRKPTGYFCGCPRLVAARGSIGAGLGDARPISSRGVGNRSIAADPAGDVLAVWQLAGPVPGNADDGVQGRFVGAGGAVGPLLRLSGRGDHDDPQAILYPDGTALVAWTRTRGAHDRIQAVRVPARP